MTNCCDPLLQPGGPDAGCCETIVDCLLAYPRFLWMGRRVTAEKNPANQWEISYEMSSMCSQQNGEANEKAAYRYQWIKKTRGSQNIEESDSDSYVDCGAILPLTILYIPAILLSGIAMPFKASILECEDQAACYSRLVKLHLKNKQLSLKKSVLDELLQEVNQEIEANQNVIKVIGRAKRK